MLGLSLLSSLSIALLTISLLSCFALLSFALGLLDLTGFFNQCLLNSPSVDAFIGKHRGESTDKNTQRDLDKVEQEGALIILKSASFHVRLPERV